MTQFKVLSDEEIDREHNNWCMRRGKENLAISWRRWIAKAQLKDTLRQVLEMLDGIENPYKVIGRQPFPLAGDLRESGKHDGFNKAIQTIKQAIEMAK